MSTARPPSAGARKPGAQLKGGGSSIAVRAIDSIKLQKLPSCRSPAAAAAAATLSWRLKSGHTGQAAGQLQRRRLSSQCAAQSPRTRLMMRWLCCCCSCRCCCCYCWCCRLTRKEIEEQEQQRALLCALWRRQNNGRPAELLPIVCACLSRLCSCAEEAAGGQCRWLARPLLLLLVLVSSLPKLQNCQARAQFELQERSAEGTS